MEDSQTVGGQQPWAAGTNKECWQRAAGADAAYVSGFYTCGNDACLKIADPQAELESKTSTGSVFLFIGFVELGIGTAGSCAAFYYMRRVKFSAGHTPAAGGPQSAVGGSA